MEKRLSPEILRERYKEATRFTTGVVFGPGDARLGPEVSVYNGTGRGQCHHRPARQHAWLTLGVVAARPVKAHTAGPLCHNRI